MNKIFTQIALGVVCLFANVANAQVNENFESQLASCWLTTNTEVKTQTTGNSSNKTVAFTNNGTALFGTPYIDFTTGSFTINFTYHLLKNNNGNSGADKVRTFQIGYQDVNGVFTPLNTATPVNVQKATNFTAPNNNTFAIPDGTYRVVIKGEANGSNENIAIDDLVINGGTYHYANPCNTPPTATNNTYAINLGQPLAGNFLTDGTADSDFDGESFAIVNFTQPDPAIGKINFAADGSFTFEGNPSDGDRITFTYQLKDNGYDPEFSQVATVTISFFQAITLPLHITSFSGNVNSNKAQLAWSVTANETGSHFEIERSTDGKSFKAISTVFTSSQAGAENYTFADAGFTGNAFYRIKMVNKDNTSAYSKTIFLKGTAASENKIILMQNPAQGNLNFTFSADTDGASEVAIYNLAGIKVQSLKVQARKGANSMSLNLDGRLPAGSYFLTIQSASSNRSVQFVKR